MKNSNKFGHYLIIALVVINLCISVFLAGYLFLPQNAGGKLEFTATDNGKYVMYIGTNDKDTYEPVMDAEEAKTVVNDICAKYVTGYTVTDAKGGWVDEKSVSTFENTLVYTFCDVNEDQMVAIMDEVRQALNQGVIMIEREDTETAYYGG